MNVEDQSVSKMEYLLLIAEVNRLARLLENTKAESRRFQEKLAALQWRRITEQDLPKVGDEVLAAFKGQFRWTMFPATMTKHNGIYASGYATPTHWMPKPLPPIIAPPADKEGA